MKNQHYNIFIMKNLTRKYNELIQGLQNLKDLPLLAIRIILAVGFLTPAMMKLQDVNAIAGWFESMNYPLPTLSAYLATATEAIGVALLILGLGTRFISIPLIIVMLVAITTVHMGNGFNAGDNGYEIPLYYMIMLFTLVVYGPGKVSLDHLIYKRTGKAAISFQYSKV